MKKRLMAFVLIIAILCPLLSSCSRENDSKFFLYIENEPQSLDPQSASDTEGKLIIRNSFQGLYEYASDPCSRFYPSFDGGTKSCPVKTFQHQEKANAMALSVDKGDIRVNLQQQQEIPSQVAAFEAVKSQPVLGRMQALQKQNEFQAQTTHQLLQMHTLMIARNQAEAYRREQEDEARAKADLFYKQLFATDSYAPMKKHVWK